MSHNFFGAGKLLPALLVLNFLLLFPAGADELDTFEDDEFFFDDNEGLTIVGTPQTTQQMAVIEKDEIERRGASDLANLLQETLHLRVNRYGAHGNQTGLTLRGIDSKRVAFLIDGVPANSAMDGKFDVNQIDLHSVERIEVIYGGSDSKYNVSGAIGGVINIITVKKQNPGWRFGGTVSNTSVMPGQYRDRSGQTQDPHWEDLADTQNYGVSAAYGGGGFSFVANAFANRAENHFIFYDSFQYIRRKDNNEVWDTGLNTTGVWELANLAKLIASTNFYYSDKNIPSSGFSSIFGNQNDFTGRQSLMLDAPRAFRDDLAAEASIAWRFSRMDYTSPADAFSRHDQNALNAINRWNWYPGEKLTLRSGIDYRLILLDSTEIGDRSRHDGGVYLTAEYKPIGQILITPSIKAVFASSGSTPMTAVPKLGLRWDVTDSVTIKNNYFRSFKYPEFEELYWTGGGGFGNPDLKPEDGWGGDLGATWRITETVKLESVFFTQWLQDSIHWYAGSGGATGSAIWRPENVGEAVFFGVDNKLDFEIPVSIGPVKKIAPSLSYQYLRSYLLSFGYTFESDKRIPYNPEHTIGGSLDISWGKGSLLISGHFESVRYNDRPNLAELEPHFLLNATVNQKTGQYLTVFGALRNILDTSYESFYDYPMPGITLTLGLRTQFEVK
jgi:vitamin B12 transporter